MLSKSLIAVETEYNYFKNLQLTYQKPSLVHQDGDNQLEAVFSLQEGLLQNDNYTCYIKQTDGQTLSRTSTASVYGTVCIVLLICSVTVSSQL